MLDTPVLLVGEPVGKLGDDLDEVGQLSGIALAEVVVGQQIQRDDADPDVVAPAEELPHLRRAGTMTMSRRVIAELTGPAPVSVDHHGDVMWRRLAIDPTPEPIDVEPIEGPSALVRRRHTPTVQRRPPAAPIRPLRAWSRIVPCVLLRVCAES